MKYRWVLSDSLGLDLHGYPYKDSESAHFIRLIKENLIVDSENREVKIGEQIWMNLNLNVEKFNNGDIILEAKSREQWDIAGVAGIPAWCYYDNNENNGKIHGKLYNWFAIIDSRGIAPNGFRIPSEEDFQTLVKQLNGIEYAVQKLTSKEHWSIFSKGTNSSGFNATPSGRRGLQLFSDTHFFKDFNEGAFYWTTKEFESEYAFAFIEQNKFDRFKKSSGFSVRCIKK